MSRARPSVRGPCGLAAPCLTPGENRWGPSQCNCNLQQPAPWPPWGQGGRGRLASRADPSLHGGRALGSYLPIHRQVASSPWMPARGDCGQWPTLSGRSSKGGSKGTFSEGACDPWPMAQECLDRVQAPLSEDLQWDQSNMRTTPRAPRTRKGNQDRGSMAQRGLAWRWAGKRVQPMPIPVPLAPPPSSHR